MPTQHFALLASRRPAATAPARHLLAALRAGDEGAIAAIAAEYGAELRALAQRIVGSADLAEEIVQDVLMHVWDRRQHRIAGSLRGHVRRVARRLAELEARRARVKAAVRRRAVVLGAHGVGEAISAHTDRALAMKDLKGAIAQIVRKLPPLSATVFLMSRDQRRTHSEIARETGLPIRAVEMHMTRALASLRAGLAAWRD